MISEPGIYFDITAEEYHADPCETPSLSSSIAKTLIAQSPQHAYLAHPKLGGSKADDDADPKTSRAKELGTLVHRLVLGKGAEITVGDFKDWRTDAAKDFRSSAWNNKLIPTLPSGLKQATAIAENVRAKLGGMSLDRAFHDGANEAVIVWREDGVLCRAMLDNLIFSGSAEIWDLKTVGRSSHPTACALQIGNLGYDISSDFYMRAVQAIRPELAGRVKFNWVFVEIQPPYSVTPVEIDGEWQMIAKMKTDRALALWRTCLESGNWPGYVNSVTKLSPKPWMLVDEMGAASSQE